MPHPLCILVADGYADAADSLALLLQLWGHEVRVARTGTDALEMARTCQPDVVLAESCLPGLSGLQLAEALRGWALLIALTGLGPTAYRRQARDAGFEHFLVKPADLNALHGLLQAMQGRRAPAITRCDGPEGLPPVSAAPSTQAPKPPRLR